VCTPTSLCSTELLQLTIVHEQGGEQPSVTELIQNERTTQRELSLEKDFGWLMVDFFRMHEPWSMKPHVVLAVGPHSFDAGDLTQCIDSYQR